MDSSNHGSHGWNTGSNDPPGTPAAGSSLRALTVGDVLDGMFRLFMRHWRVFLVALGAIVIPYYVLSFWLTLQTMGVSPLDLFGNPELLGTTYAAGGNTAAATANFVLTLVVAALTVGVAFRIAAEAQEGGRPSVTGVWRAAVARFWSLAGVLLLIGIIFIASFVVMAVVMANAAATGSPALAFLAVALFVLALYAVATYLSMTFPVVVVERKGPGAAIRRSVRLVRGRFWRTLGTLLLVVLIANIVFFVLIFGTMLPASAMGEAASAVLFVIVLVIGILLMASLITNAVTLLYYDARVRDEGYDLEVMTQGLTGVAPPPSEQPFA